MALFGGKKDETEPASDGAIPELHASASGRVPGLAPTVFEPQPLEDWDPGDSAGADLPDFGSPDFYLPAKKSSPKKGAGKKDSAKKDASRKPRFEVRPPEPGMSEAERRAALRTQMADLTRAYQDAPLEEMEGAIKETLAAYGQDVPDAWVTTIAEGLRKHGPTRINYDGTGFGKE